MNPLDLPGPQFLQFFGIVMAGVFVAALLVRLALGAGGVAGPDVDALDATEAAYLAGGPGQVGLVVVRDLVTRGAAKLDRLSRTLTGVKGAAMPVDPTHRRVLAAAGAGGVPLRQLSGVLRHDLDQIRRTLQTQNLLVGDEGVWLSRAVTLLLLTATLTLGGLKIAVGISRNRPVEFLVLLCLVLTVAMVCLTTGRFRTAAGRRLLRRLRARYPRPSTRTSDDMPLAVWGPAALTDHPDDAALKTCFAASGGSGGGGSDGGSSCGGGGCGGGGCGGCGGD